MLGRRTMDINKESNNGQNKIDKFEDRRNNS